MTDLALGAKSGWPVGGVQRECASSAAERATPSRQNIEPRASPAKPMPTSARKVRRGKRPQKEQVVFIGWSQNHYGSGAHARGWLARIRVCLRLIVSSGIRGRRRVLRPSDGGRALVRRLRQ